jgi:hypothetical protein
MNAQTIKELSLKEMSDEKVSEVRSYLSSISVLEVSKFFLDFVDAHTELKNTPPFISPVTYY